MIKLKPLEKLIEEGTVQTIKNANGSVFYVYCFPKSAFRNYEK